MKEIPQQELNALIHLLDDPDEEVFRHVTDKLISYGTEVIPRLEQAWEKTFDPQLHFRLEELIHLIQYETLLQQLQDWKKEGGEDLMQGALLVSRYQYPDLNLEKVYEQVERIVREIWLEMNYDLTPLEQVNVFNHVLFTINKFSANTQNIHDYQNSFINMVLDTKRGNQASLAVLYLVLAEKIKMPVYGVNLPEHFVLSFHKDFIEEDDSENQIKSSIIFYINPVNKGIIFSRDDIKVYLKKLSLEPKPEYFLPCSNVQIIITLISTLVHSFEQAGMPEKVMELIRLREALQER